MLPFINILGRSIPMYGLMIATGIFLAVIYVYFYSKNNNLKWEHSVLIGVCGVGLGFVGAKLLFILVTFTPYGIFQMIKNWQIEPMINGGFVFYGGLIFGIIGGLLGAKLIKSSVLDYGKAIVPIIPFCHAFGRIGCFFAGCCYGKVTDSAWGVVFTKPFSHTTPVGVPLIPIQLYEAGALLVISAVLMILNRKKIELSKILSVYCISYGILRLITEQFRGDAIRGFYFGLSTSMWISLALILAGVILIFVKFKKRGEVNGI